MSSARAPLLAALLVLPILSACNHPGAPAKPPLARALPAVGTIVPDPAPPPVPKLDDDARIVAKRFMDWGDENAKRLEQAADNYGALRDRLAEGEPVK